MSRESYCYRQACVPLAFAASYLTAISLLSIACHDVAASALTELMHLAYLDGSTALASFGVVEATAVPSSVVIARFAGKAERVMAECRSC